MRLREPRRSRPSDHRLIPGCVRGPSRRRPFQFGPELMTPRRALKDMIEPIDKHEPIDTSDAHDAIEPIDRNDPTEPTDKTDPLEPIDSTEFSDHSDHLELWAPDTRKMLKPTSR